MTTSGMLAGNRTCELKPEDLVFAKQEGQGPLDIIQQIVPSSGTKLVCTKCGREDFHYLLLRRRRGLIEGLCKQKDGSGCYPMSARTNCQYTYPNNMDCPQLSEYEIFFGADMRGRTVTCQDHINQMMGQDTQYTIYPIED